MHLLITVPRSGSHVFGRMLQCKMIVTFQKDTTAPKFLSKPKSEIQKIISKLPTRRPYRFWLHLPHDTDYELPVSMCEKSFLLLRDPRDIIISHAYIVDKIPTIGLNYIIGDVRLTDLHVSKRIDFLVDNIRPMLEWFEGWRLFGLRTLHYEDLILSPFKIYRELSALGYGTVTELQSRAMVKEKHHFRKGIVGDWKNEFSPKQQRKAFENFGDIIEKWLPN